MDKPVEYQKTIMRVFLIDEDYNPIEYNRADDYETTVRL